MVILFPSSYLNSRNPNEEYEKDYVLFSNQLNELGKSLLVTITRNSNQSSDTNKPSDELIQKYSHLQSSFYTVDYAECEDGSFKIIETGDGGVSGLPNELSPNAFYEKIGEIIQARNKDTEFEK